MQDQSKINGYRQKLEDERKKLLQAVGEENKSPDFGSDIEDTSSEEADEAEEFGNNLSVAAAYKERISEIDLALSKITKGEYGVCEQCRGPIGAMVLDVVPESKLCETCKKQ